MKINLKSKKWAMSANQLLERNQLAYKLVPISVREILFSKDLPCDVFSIKNGLIKLILKKRSFINMEIIRDLIEQDYVIFFTPYKQRNQLIEYQRENLRKVTRSLSMGNKLDNCKKQVHLLTINLEYLYLDPTDDDTLDLVFQSARNLSSFLYDHVELHEPLYQAYLKQNHQYIFAQPFLSSLFLLGVLKHSRMYSKKDVESFFLASFFKDIGMSAIPSEKYNQKKLSHAEKELLSRHPAESVNILQGRIPLAANHLQIIENHHAFSLLGQDIQPDDKIQFNKNVILGSETMLVCMMDVISAMISGRPYRPATDLFTALDLTKNLISDDFPQEFKIIVNYFRSFFFAK